ncbi:hypothetical protein [Citrobacter freundii]|uniref:hypothetical protein n=1 Tax=Citrobacter freundii TaxID=546 RepID=UPI00300C2587
MERFTQDILKIDKFVLRVGRFFLHAVCLFWVGIIPGILGFMLIEGRTFSEATLNAISMAGAQGVHFPPVSILGKYFIAVYGFFLQAIFFVILGVVISPFVHRILHRWHLNNNKQNDN